MRQPCGLLAARTAISPRWARQDLVYGHAGDADLISFGRPFISNPDLLERFKNDWPLAETAPMSDWYSPSGPKGYRDFPAYGSELAASRI